MEARGTGPDFLGRAQQVSGESDGEVGSQEAPLSAARGSALTETLSVLFPHPTTLQSQALRLCWAPGKGTSPFHLERFPLHPLGKTLSGHPSCPPSPPGSSPGLPVTMPSLHPHHEDLAQLLLNSPIRGSTGVVVGWGQCLSQQRAHHSLSS